MELERAVHVIEAIPYISKQIIDDTLYEKVLSFLIMVLTHEPKAIQTFQRKDIFQHIKKACLMENQDYRVITLCIRLLGQLVNFGHCPIFQDLQTYPELLKMVTTGLRSSEPALRSSCLEACRYFILCPSGSNWLSNDQQATLYISLALLDQSHFVVVEACRLFSTCLLSQNELLVLLDPSDQIKAILAIQSNPSQLMASLELCWSIVNVKKSWTLDYLHQTRLLVSVMPLVCSTHRMVRSRVIEILTVLFSWDPNPIKTLDLQAQIQDLDQAYEVMLRLAKQMIVTQPMDIIMTGVDLLQAIIELIKRTNSTCQDLENLLFSLLNTCLDQEQTLDHVSLLLKKSTRTRNNLLQATLRVLGSLSVVKPISGLDTIFAVFENKDAYTDPRVLKSGLILLQRLEDKGLELLVDMMDRGEFDARGISLLLDTMDIFLNHLNIETPLLEKWVETLSYKFLDTEWDIRDAVIHFVGQLFRQPIHENKVSFALKYDLPLNILERIQDKEPFVRASAVDVLQNMMKSKQGWDYIQQHQQSRYFLASQLPSLLYDTEAFVKRAALDAMDCLVQNRSCQGMAMEIENKPNTLNPGIIKTLVDDADPDIRIKACKLIESLWYLYQHEKQQNKKRVVMNHVVFFHSIPAAELLVQSANDTHRLVRSESVRIIFDILETKSKENNRFEDEFDEEFITKITQVNIQQQKQTLDPEHIYEEAFDINVDMMIHHQKENILDCE